MTDEAKKEEELASLGEPEHIARERLKNEPAVQEIAASLGVEIDEYIDQIIFYARRPNLEAQVEYVPTEELIEEGINVPTQREVLNWIDKVDSGEIDLADPDTGMSDRSNYTEIKEEKEVLQEALGARTDRVAPKQEDLQGRVKTEASPTGSVLRRQLMQQRQQTRLAVDAKQRARGVTVPQE